MTQHFTVQACEHIADTYTKQNVDPAASQQLTAAHIRTMLGETGHTFASLTQCTKVATAAAFKDEITILKMTYSSISIASKLKEMTNLYTNAIKRSASKIEGNDEEAIAEFQSQGNWFEHTEVYSIVQHKTNANLYLFALYNKVYETVYFNPATGLHMTKEEVATYLTKSAAAALMQEGAVNHSVSTGLAHTVYVRAIGMQNVVQLTAAKSQFIA